MFFSNPELRLEFLAATAAAAAAATAAEPQPQAFDPGWYPHRRIKECKREHRFFSTTSFLLIPSEARPKAELRSCSEAELFSSLGNWVDKNEEKILTTPTRR